MIYMDRPDWDSYFMNIAEQVKKRSLDPKRQVGAVLVSIKDKRILSTGYNSLASGLDDNINWEDRDYVHKVIIHAECNVLLYAKSIFEDSILYTTTSPCLNCLKLLSAAKIKKVIYKEPYRDIQEVIKLSEFFGIIIQKF